MTIISSEIETQKMNYIKGSQNNRISKPFIFSQLQIDIKFSFLFSSE